MKTAAKTFLRKKGILDEDKNHWIIKYEDGREVDLVELFVEFASQFQSGEQLKKDERLKFISGKLYRPFGHFCGYNEHFPHLGIGYTFDDCGKLNTMFDGKDRSILEKVFYTVDETMICPVTQKRCDDECCPVGSECNLKSDDKISAPSPQGEQLSAGVFGVDLSWNLKWHEKDLSVVMKAADCRFIGTIHECLMFIDTFKPKTQTAEPPKENGSLTPPKEEQG